MIHNQPVAVNLEKVGWTRHPAQQSKPIENRVQEQHRQTLPSVINKCLGPACKTQPSHQSDVIMGAMASQITSLTIVCSTVYSGADQRKHQSSLSLAFVRGIHRWPVNSPHKGPVTRKMFPFDDVIMRFWLIGSVPESAIGTWWR